MSTASLTPTRGSLASGATATTATTATTTSTISTTSTASSSDSRARHGVGGILRAAKVFAATAVSVVVLGEYAEEAGVARR
ncbi:hypothetical protein [Streptomyces sp. NPDC091268]|uniref:hypothetical protein n=1 Tax=Streptomyces sp. NPDC091268 TaxID=3365979 RepID=UPI003804F0CA